MNYIGSLNSGVSYPVVRLVNLSRITQTIPIIITSSALFTHILIWLLLCYNPAHISNMLYRCYPHTIILRLYITSEWQIPKRWNGTVVLQLAAM